MANSLAITQETTIGSDGIATIVVGPAIRGETWDVEYLAVSTTSALTTEAFLYRDSISDHNALEATENGNADNTAANVRLTAPELLWVYWRNGTPGTRAMLRIEGKRAF